ncbi:MAG: DUF3841 domain-containing protein [Acidithiobacillus sp.]
MNHIEFFGPPSLEEIAYLSGCSPETLVTIWTRQQEGAVELLNTEGILVARAEHTFPAGHSVGKRSAYEWMRSQMQKRIPSYDSSWPVWVSLTPLGNKEDLAPGDRLICARVPKKRLLMSFYNPWEHILQCMALIERSDGLWPAVWGMMPYLAMNGEGKDRLGRANNCISNIPECECRESWERIFDLSLACTAGFSGGNFLQATLSEIHISDVVGIT